MYAQCFAESESLSPSVDNLEIQHSLKTTFVRMKSAEVEGCSE